MRLLLENIVWSCAELIWRCILKKHLAKLSAIILGCMSAAILLAEATLLPSGVHLSLFSLLINAGGKEEVLVQVSFRKDYTYMCFIFLQISLFFIWNSFQFFKRQIPSKVIKKKKKSRVSTLRTLMRAYWSGLGKLVLSLLYIDLTHFHILHIWILMWIFWCNPWVKINLFEFARIFAKAFWFCGFSCYCYYYFLVMYSCES